MKTALVQLSAGSNKKENIAKAVSLVEQCIRKGAEFVLLPEAFSFRGNLKEFLPSVAETIPGESTAPLMALAKKYNVFILAGSIYEKIKGSAKAYNSSVLINDRGDAAAVYRKTHLFELNLPAKKINESDYLMAGEKAVVAQVQAFKAGFSICYDLRFPELYRDYFKKNTEILCAPSAFTFETGKAHWQTLLKARAIENLSYVLAPNQCGGEGQIIPCYGHSMIVGPWGEILAEASEDKEEIIFADLRKEQIEEKRRILPLFGK